ncbi:unnamed protein product, partial [Didymodactylos carnosus]
WIRSLQPVYRCNPKIYESVLIHGHVMGRSFVRKLKNPEFAAYTTNRHARIRQILNYKGEAMNRQVQELIKPLVELEFIKAKFIKDDGQEQVKSYLISSKTNVFKSFLSDDDIHAIKRKTQEIAQDSIQLCQNQTVIGHHVDAAVGINEYAVNILCPHTG